MKIKEELFHYFEKAGTKIKYSPQEIIYMQEDDAKNLYLITKGRVRIYVMNPTGEEVTLEIIVFARTTLVWRFLFPFLLEFFASQPVFHHYLNDPLLASIIAGCLIGIGVGLVLKANASTGGVDILAILLHRKLGAPVHIVLNITDLTILLFQFSFNDTTHVIYGIVTVMMTTIMLNKTLTAGTSLMQLVVISDYYEDIKDMILHDHDAGVTLLASEKGYTEENSKLVLSILPYRKLPDIKEKVNQIDPLAFMIVSHVDEVGGKGFTLEKK